MLQIKKLHRTNKGLDKLSNFTTVQSCYNQKINTENISDNTSLNI